MSARPQLRSKFKASENTQLVRQGCFLCHYSLATSTTNRVQIFTGLFYRFAYVEIHTVVQYVSQRMQTCRNKPVNCTRTPNEKTGLWQLPNVSSAFIRWLNVWDLSHLNVTYRHHLHLLMGRFSCLILKLLENVSQSEGRSMQSTHPNLIVHPWRCLPWRQKQINNPTMSNKGPNFGYVILQAQDTIGNNYSK